MKKLIRRPRYFLGFGILWVIVQTLIFIFRPQAWKLYAAAFPPLLLATSLLFIKARMDLKAARLIVENQILYIQPAVFQEQSGQRRGTFPRGGAIEVFVSCFGILMDSKIIRFNQNGIHLKAVTLGHDFITLTYCTKKKTYSIKLLHGVIDDTALDTISRKFRYETGISPIVTI